MSRIITSETQLSSNMLKNPRQQLNDSIIERNIIESIFISVIDTEVLCDEKPLHTTRHLETNGSLSIKENYFQSRFYGNDNSYQIRFKLPKPLKIGNGVSVKFRINGWSNVRYFAIGHTSEENNFQHIKIPNPIQGEWVVFSINYEDFIFALKSNGCKPKLGQIKDIRLYIKGHPINEGGTIDASWVAAWYEDSQHQPEWMQFNGDELCQKDKTKNILFSLINQYFTKCNPNITEQVENFLRTGNCPLIGKTNLSWPINKTLPQLSQSGTYIYLWHAMQPAISMMVYAHNKKTLSPVFAARDFISNWLESNLFNTVPDTKYTWYDHGTAERLLAFLFMFHIGYEQAFDYRFMSRLKLAIFNHARLMESEAFYACHQPIRYHNHAWFQDLALIATSIVMDTFPCSNRWLDQGITRLTDQLSQMIVRDQGFSIFIENSIGYHHGIQRLVDFAGKLIQLTGRCSEIPAIASELGAWTKLMRYPDGRCPSQGDTFRNPNHIDKNFNLRDEPYENPCAWILSKAGYVVVKANHDNRPFMLCCFSTTLSKTHKHEDNLSITLYFDGIEWLIDPSFYSHEYKNKIPAYLRSAYAHNAICILDKEYSIEPCQATLNGHVKPAWFSFTGTHYAYSNYKIHRKIIGKYTTLALRVKDHIEPISFNHSLCESYLIFHIGEGVSVEIINHCAYLFHVNSDYVLKLDIPNYDIKIFNRLDNDELFLSVSGGGFMQINNTTTIAIKIPIGQVIEWDLRAIKNKK